MWWRRATATLLGVSFGSYMRCHRDILMRRRGCVPLRRLGDVPLRRLADVPLSTFWKSIEVFSVKKQYIYCIFETFMTSIYEKKISAEVRFFHAEQVSLYNFIILTKKQWIQMKIAQLKQDNLNQ